MLELLSPQAWRQDTLDMCRLQRDRVMSEAGEILQTGLLGVGSDGHDMFTTTQGPGEDAQLDPKGPSLTRYGTL